MVLGEVLAVKRPRLEARLGPPRAKHKIKPNVLPLKPLHPAKIEQNKKISTISISIICISTGIINISGSFSSWDILGRDVNM